MLIHFELPTDFEPAYRTLHRTHRRTHVPVDVVETEKGTVVTAELPGVSREDLRVTYEQEVLTIGGARKEREIPEEARIILHEQRTRVFKRSIIIGHPVDADRLTARLENGILRVELPKAESARPKVIAIQ